MAQNTYLCLPMDSFTLYIKNMVCPRCIESVKDVCRNEGYEVMHVELGKVELAGQSTNNGLDQLGKLLHERGFELLRNKNQRVVEQIKTEIIQMVHYKQEADSNKNLSHLLSESIGQDYSSLSKLFSSVEGITIEKYAIRQKIERVKELLAYDELSLKEIAWQMGYSSAQHLSAQFKKVTGLSPSGFKKSQTRTRKSLDQV